ncbi:hypothetical protein V1520DRAFT_365253 [Lipomyces starkeyi]|uniref:Uncharacterized protein n=1 Tax=Lipomyces starkeyi NRRL Y-11557 TaxID=675824 RepID=A0A1E3PY42_LIPST|nr:hypothetical protein LIPSTDRAFT_30207 [Lipomyces starkeyi NRRL Y-11557]
MSYSSDEELLDYSDSEYAISWGFPSFRVFVCREDYQINCFGTAGKVLSRNRILPRTPGYVATEILNKFTHTTKGVWTLPAVLARWILIPVLQPFGRSIDDAGEWSVFIATSAKYPPAETKQKDVGVALPKGAPIATSTVVKDGLGNGVYRLDNYGETVKNKGDTILENYRSNQTRKKIFRRRQYLYGNALVERPKS